MTRIDWVILERIASRVATTLMVFFGLFCLVESLDSWRFQTLSSIGGPPLALLAIVNGAARIILGTLAVTVLIGAILGVLDLQRRRELTVILASGVSIWRVLRAPVLAALVFGAAVSFALIPITHQIDRGLPATATRAVSGDLWLEQKGSDGEFILHADRAASRGTELYGVSIFLRADAQPDRIEAELATLTPGAWELTNATRYQSDALSEHFASTRIGTTTTAGEMRIRLASSRDLTFGEMLGILSQNIADPTLRASLLTSLLGLVSLPISLAGSVIVAFAFSSGYRRTNKVGAAVLYGVILGFVVYVVMELATRAGNAGLLDPIFAAVGPAFGAICVGLTVLLFKEDGRT